MVARSISRVQNATPWLHKQGCVHGVQLHWVEAGQQEAPLVMLLHGMPGFWYTWCNLLVGLANAGYRVVAPDARGCNLSDKPRTGYDVQTLSEDCYELICLLTTQKVYLVGHDWGGMIAAATAARFPERVHKVVLVNAAHFPQLHPSRLAFRQRIRLRAFICLARASWLARLVLGCQRAWCMSRCCFHPLAESWDDPGTVTVYRDAACQPGTLACFLRYIQQLDRSVEQSLQWNKLRVPVLVVAGERDRSVLVPTGSWKTMSEWVDDNVDTSAAGGGDSATETVLLSCGHWVPHECPRELETVLLRFLAKP
jgi:epoxide hydrolase 4